MPEPPLISTHHTARRWLPSEVALLRDLNAAGWSVADIAAEIGKSRSAVYGQMDRSGLLPDKVRRKEPKLKTYKPPKPTEFIKASSFLEATVKAGEHNMKDWDWKPTGTPEPVPFRQGTPEKVEAMAARVEAGVEIWCESDGVKETETTG